MRLSLPARRTLLLGVLVIGCLVLGLQTAKAALTVQALDWSSRLLDLPDAWRTSEPRELLVNGARLGITSGHSDLSMPALLDSLQASCRARSRLGSALVPRPRHDLPGLLDGVLRIDNASSGMVACLELGSEPLAVHEVLRRLQSFASSGDLVDLGAVRLVRVEAREQGAFFVAVASIGSLPLPLMFPSAGDAPGMDSELAPRPVHARRTFSAWQLGREPCIHVYETSQSLEVAFAGYLQTLRDRGVELLAEHELDASTRAALVDVHGHPLLVAVTRANGVTSLVLSTLDDVRAHKSSPVTQPR